MIELEKMYISIAKNPHNFSAHWIIEISLILHSAHVVSRDHDKFVFYVNNYIDWNQFNQLYDPDWIEKGIKNADAVVHKLGSASPRAINDRLEVAREERRRRKEMMERQKAEVMVAKRHRSRGGISLSSEEEDESDTKNDTDPDQANLDQANDKCPMEL